ncbi:Uncharacterised protein [Klebsiella pneumoniae]|uniref:hypothetical protein n=1 Tax=Klebsiella pneumoniae TaxID=573 RepID=UPI000E2D2841|nr:hypothetical protein [Klebsiella pneumoniae]SYU11849.1 Uncharacterised protein [Klebsiella pneumoniae]
MMNESSAPDNVYGYFERNRWLVIVLSVVMLNASVLIGVFFLHDLGQDQTIYSVIGGCIKAFSILLLIYAGIRMVVLVVMFAGFIAFLLKTLNLY